MSTQSRFMLKAAVYLIPRRGDEVLLLLRKNTGWKDGFYSLIAGHIESGETAQEAMLREAKEEGGVEIKESSLRFAHVIHRLDQKIIDNDYIDIFFECNDWDGEFINAEPSECAGLAWFSINDLPYNTIKYVKDAIAMCNQEIYFSSRRDEI